MKDDIHTFCRKGQLRTTYEHILFKVVMALRVVLSLRTRDEIRNHEEFHPLPFSPTAAQPVCACQTASA